jgi:hypothetical protein
MPEREARRKRSGIAGARISPSLAAAALPDKGNKKDLNMTFFRPFPVRLAAAVHYSLFDSGLDTTATRPWLNQLRRDPKASLQNFGRG